jgi:hypothetical protein
LQARSNAAMKLLECWRWRYRDPATGRICRTLRVLSDDEARQFPERERIPGTLMLREVDDQADFADTEPWIGSPGEPGRA